MTPQAGFTTLAISLLLLAILSSLTLFMGQALVSERRLTLNEIEYRLTHAAAEQGLAEAIAQLKVEPNIHSLARSVTHDLGEVSYEVNIAPHGSLAGVRQLTATASMNSGARSRVSLALAERTVLNPQHAGPTSPLMLGGANTVVNGQLQIVAQQDNADMSSVWSAGNLNVHGELHTCALADYDTQARHCSVSLSQVDAHEQRLEQDVRLADASFPAELLDYVFGYDASQWPHLARLATAVVQDCSQIQRAGFYIVSNGVSCQLDQVVSSYAAPVILLVKDMAVTANTPTQLHGLLVLYGTDSTARSLSLANGSELIGGLIMGAGNAELNGDFVLRYDASLLCTMSACQPAAGASPFRLLSVIAGSWHDD
ncbi:hypothetical protein CBP31_10360 [Oceanisphaera profunda]|uniref:Type 4 fimbrial biogenesis protein PilX N-terminal domain-containing protein n=1 Tax=Oceanisphaera profunda TaxID=1416627 RepID=A0A1Y0D617_9GAMM|nr:PilX N-terminal domain-containing pilus assembly protein [Oceanisphaera profunda]ART82979.1 hypothetical protein CBP31_10360 [Oceanisphaera profunda]